MQVYVKLSGTLSAPQGIKGTLSAAKIIEGALTVPKYVYPPAYTGEVEVTPGAEAQVLATSDKYVATDIIIRPIPNNYGLITWDGSVITVS